MKKIVEITYKATDEEIEILRKFYNFLDTLDEEIYKDFDNRAAELGVFEATQWMLEVVEGD